jgi:hypothetical protein
MYQKSNGPLRHGGLSLAAVVAMALAAGLSAIVAGCPGPDPHTAPGGSGGTSSSSATSASSGVTDCGGSEICAPSPPGGWEGPYEVFQGTTVACPSGTTSTVHGGLNPVGAAATCANCTCGTTLLSCGDPTASLWGDSTCTGTACATGTLTGTCTLLKTANTTTCAGTSGLWVSVSAPPVVGTCTASVLTPTTTKASWTTEVVACSLSTTPKTCSGGVCAPGPTSQSTFKLCIVQAGSPTACPSTAYPQLIVIDTVIADNRSCGNCSCESPTGVCQGGKASFASDCVASTVGQTVPLTCAPLSIPATNAVSGVLSTPAQLLQPSCTPSGGGPTGGVTGSSPVTLCCM